MNTIENAEKWASSVWRRNVTGWRNRDQDYNYRQFLARPAMRKAIGRISPLTSGTFLDLGCGDGRETNYLRNCLIEEGYSGQFYGFDIQPSLINVARKKYCEENPIRMFFDHGRLDFLVEKHELEHKTDRIFSTFLLQELADADRHLKLAMKSMRPYSGCGIFLFLDPTFGQAMLEKGAVKVNDNLGKTENWQWAGEYPIVEENGGTFYVPYFHRSLDDYKKIVSKYFGRFWYRQFAPGRRTLQKSEREHISPFCDHSGNIYYPEITSIPSTLIFIVDQPMTMPQIF